MSEHEHNNAVEEAENFAKELDQETPAAAETTTEGAAAGEITADEINADEPAVEGEEPSLETGEEPAAEGKNPEQGTKAKKIKQQWLIIGAAGLVLLVLIITMIALIISRGKNPPEVDPAQTTTASVTQQGGPTQPTQPSSPEYDQGLAFFNNSQYDDAIRSFTQAMRGNPNNARTYTFRGASYYLKQLYPEALSDLNRAIALDANEKYAYEFRARVHDAMGNTAAATEDRSKSIQLGG